MLEATPERKRSAPAADALLGVGRLLFSLAIIGVGIETLVCARRVGHSLGPQYDVIPVIPWLPAFPWLAYLFGAIWVFCGAGLLFRRTMRMAAATLGTLLLVCALVLRGAQKRCEHRRYFVAYYPIRTSRDRKSGLAAAGTGRFTARARKRKPLPARDFPDRVRSGSFPGTDVYRGADTGLDSLA